MIPRRWGFSFILSVGPWGGFYIDNYIPIGKGFIKRICLGWIALDFMPEEFDTFLDTVADMIDELEELKNSTGRKSDAGTP